VFKHVTWWFIFSAASGEFIFWPCEYTRFEIAALVLALFIWKKDA
jgi:hypothetical protein